MALFQRLVRRLPSGVWLSGKWLMVFAQPGRFALDVGAHASDGLGIHPLAGDDGIRRLPTGPPAVRSMVSQSFFLSARCGRRGRG